jgi:hypothetical protein
MWLLRRLGGGNYSEALMGDLIEQCARGQTGGWAWREIVVAIVIAQARRCQSSQWLRLARLLWWCLAEMSIVLSVALMAAKSENGRTLKDVFTPNFIVTMFVLFSVAYIGLRSLIRIHRLQRQRTAIHSLMASFLVMSLGVGTLTWAATAHYAKEQPIPRDRSTISAPTISEPSMETPK